MQMMPQITIVLRYEFGDGQSTHEIDEWPFRNQLSHVEARTKPAVLGVREIEIGNETID